MSSVECAFVLSSENLNESMKYTIIKIIKEERPETIGKLIKFVQQTTDVSEKEIINLLKSKYPNRYFRTSINMPNGKFSSFFVDELNELELNVKNMCQKLDTV